MKLEFSILLVALVIMNNFLGSVASGHANYTCYSDSLALFTDMSNNGANKTYHICPNTMWSIGDYDSRTNKFVDGDWPVVIMHSDTKVLCGPHGHVADNCTIISKATGVEIINAYYYNKGPPKFLALQNILIQGFIFTGQSTNSHIIYSYYVFLSEVDLTVRDCKFIDNPNARAIINVEAAGKDGREHAVIENCLFQNNYIGQHTNLKNQILPNAGLIIGFDAPEIEVYGSQFYNNTFDDKIEFSALIFAPTQKYNSQQDLFTSDANVTIKGSCFIDNKGMTYSLAESTNVEDAGNRNNNYASQNEFKLTDVDRLCNGFTKQNTVKSLPSCSTDGFQEPLCPLWEAPSATPSKAPPSATPSKAPSKTKTVTDTSVSMILSCHMIGTTVLILSSTFLSYFM